MDLTIAPAEREAQGGRHRRKLVARTPGLKDAMWNGLITPFLLKVLPI